MRYFILIVGSLMAAILSLNVVEATEGVKGNTVRPDLDKAKVKGCRIAKPGDYKVSRGDLIELDYTYPVVPGSIPDKVSYKKIRNAAVVPSSLGIRSVVQPGRLGGGTIAFYFQARRKGKGTVVLIIDGAEYTYHFTVVK
jgi:hypothetical protein